MKYNPFRAALKELEICKRRYLEILAECPVSPNDEQFRQMDAFLSALGGFANDIHYQAEAERRTLREWQEMKRLTATA